MIKTVPEKYLNAFYINWRRTVFMWKVNSYQFDIYYRSPEKGSAKCRFNPDVGKYLEKFPNSAITNANLLLYWKPLGLNNQQVLGNVSKIQQSPMPTFYSIENLWDLITINNF
jgi:hypothetical protein